MSEAGECCIISENGQTVADVQSSNEIEKGVMVEEKDMDTPNPEEQMGEDCVPVLDFPLLVDSRSSTPSDGNSPCDDVDTPNPEEQMGEDCIPILDFPLLVDSRSSTPCEYETSSGSPSPVPEDGSETPSRPKISLGRDISLMMKALNSLHSPEEKIAALCKKYADLLEQQKMKEKRLRGMERKGAQSAKEREQIQKELNKAILGKSKMESLARELNKQNKLLKEESYQLTISHNKERELISVKFQSAADEISGKISEIADRNELLNNQNRVMSEKIANLVKETSSREQMIKAMMDQRDLQEQILELKLKKAEEERDIALLDVESRNKDVAKAQTVCEEYSKQEKELRMQITLYSEKLSDFQSISNKSNKIFKSFRSEVDAMNGKMRDLEKTTSTWKKKYNEAVTENQRIFGDNTEQARNLKLLNIKVAKLSDLSRALQTERNDLMKKVSSLQKNPDTVTAEATSTVADDTQLSNQSQGQPGSDPSPPTQSSGMVPPDSSNQGDIPSLSQKEVEPQQLPTETVQLNPESSTPEDLPAPGTEPETAPQSTEPLTPHSVPSVNAEADSSSEETQALVTEMTQARISEAGVSSSTTEE